MAKPTPTERAKLLKVLRALDWNILAASKALGISRQGLYDKLERLGIEREIPVDWSAMASRGGIARAKGLRLRAGAAA